MAIPQMEKVGARKEKVPPCTMGSLFPTVVCISVVMPLMKNMVPINIPSATGSSDMPRGLERISGIATVDPNMVR